MPELTEEQKQRRRDNLAKARAARKERRAAAAPSGSEEREHFRAILDDDMPALPQPVAPEPVADPPGSEPFDLFVRSLDDETRRILSEMELRAIYEAQLKRAQDEKKSLLQKRTAERALHHAKVEQGLLPTTAIAHADWEKRMSRPVRYTIDLPEFGDVGLRVNGKIYRHGDTVDCTFGEMLSFREACWRARQVELDFEGKSKLSHLRRIATGALNQTW